MAYLGHERGWTTARAPSCSTRAGRGWRGRRSISGDFADELGNAALSDARDPFAAAAAALARATAELLSLVSRDRARRGGAVRRDGGEPEVVVGGDREVAAFSVSRDGRAPGVH